MLYGAGVFILIALVAALLGYEAAAGAAAGVAQFLFIAGLTVRVVLLLIGRRPPGA